jgi:hypothetical protein
VEWRKLILVTGDIGLAGESTSGIDNDLHDEISLVWSGGN